MQTLYSPATTVQRPSWAVDNPFAYVVGVSWMQFGDVATRVRQVQGFSLEQCRDALSVLHLQKEVVKACVRRIKDLYLQESLDLQYPMPADTLAHLRRLARTADGYPRSVNAIAEFICWNDDCADQSRKGQRHRANLTYLIERGYLVGNSVSKTVTFQRKPAEGTVQA